METLNFNTPVRDSEGNIKNLSEVGGGGGGSAKHTYSTEEHVVGTWIDDKPIYEKTLILAGNALPYNTADLTIDKLISLEGFYTNGDSYVNMNTSFSGLNAWCVYVKTANEIRGTITGPVVPNQIVITINYTKTTD